MHDRTAIVPGCGLFALALLVLASCPGRRSQPIDGGVRGESTLIWPDRGRTDARRPADARRRDSVAATTSCKGTFDCATQCTTTACLDTCMAATCPAGSAAAQSLYVCGISQCAQQCMTGYSATCVTCIAASCKLQYALCIAQVSCT